MRWTFFKKKCFLLIFLSFLAFHSLNGEILYRNGVKNREFDKEAPQNFDPERVTIAERQGASEDRNYEGKPTWSKTDSSHHFGIPTERIHFQEIQSTQTFAKEHVQEFLTIPGKWIVNSRKSLCHFCKK